VEVVVSLSQGRTATAQCGLFTHKSVPVIFEPPCILLCKFLYVFVTSSTFYCLRDTLMDTWNLCIYYIGMYVSIYVCIYVCMHVCIYVNGVKLIQS